MPGSYKKSVAGSGTEPRLFKIQDTVSLQCRPSAVAFFLPFFVSLVANSRKIE